jgi:hypothetical protein
VRRDDYLRAVKQLDLQAQDYIVVGSGVLSALGLREAGDVDLIVSPAVYEQFEATGAWRRKYYPDGTYGLANGSYEVGLNWDGRDGEPNLQDLKRQEIIIDGVPFMDLARLRAWKQAMGRPKDLADILLIDRYLSDLNQGS